MNKKEFLTELDKFLTDPDGNNLKDDDEVDLGVIGSDIDAFVDSLAEAEAQAEGEDPDEDEDADAPA